jgi:uncharacterized oxidoreductase
MNMNGKTVLITGGTSGIGFELARQLVARGSTVLVTGRDQARLAAVRKQLPQVHTFASDVTERGAIPALLAEVTARFPSLDVLVNNAGIMRVLSLHDAGAGLDDLTREVATNLIGPMQMVAQFLPHLKNRPEAASVNVTSGLAFVPLAISPIYSATKAGLHTYTLCLRSQLAKTTVKVFELAPPATTTALTTDFPPDLSELGGSMDVARMVAVAVRGLERDRLEILPGPSVMLRLMGRLAPRFTLNTKGGERWLLQSESPR